MPTPYAQQFQAAGYGYGSAIYPHAQGVNSQAPLPMNYLQVGSQLAEAARLAKLQAQSEGPIQPHHYQLPHPSYRESGEQSTAEKPIDQSQRDLLSRIAKESEGEGSTSRRRAGNSESKGLETASQGPIERFLTNWVPRIPKLAEQWALKGSQGSSGQAELTPKPTMDGEEPKPLVTDGGWPWPSQFRTTTIASSKPIVPTGENEDGEAEGESVPRPMGISSTSRAEEKYGPAKLVNSMPDPAALFNFNKLFSSFGLNTRPEGISSGSAYGPEGTGRVSRELSRKPVESKGSGGEDKELIPHRIGGTPRKSSGEARTTTPNPAENLLGSLLNGNFQKIDWIGSLLGNASSSSTEEMTAKQEGNALAQIFSGSGAKGLSDKSSQGIGLGGLSQSLGLGGLGQGLNLGSFLGSGLDDDPKIKGTDGEKRGRLGERS